MRVKGTDDLQVGEVP